MIRDGPGLSPRTGSGPGTALVDVRRCADHGRSRPVPLRPSTLLASLLLLSGLGACGPVYRASAAPAPAAVSAVAPAVAQAAPQAVVDPARLLGSWALTDPHNVLFNLILEPRGQALRVGGASGPRPVLAGPLRPDEVARAGRWQRWGNGIRVDFANGWSEAVLDGPAGLEQWTWGPGRDRSGPPSARSKAVRVDPAALAVTGAYRITPTQPEMPPYTASLLSSGRAFNSIDAIPGGSWSPDGTRVVIDWSSGWRTVFEPRLRGPFPASHWAPGADRNGPPSGVRQAERLH